MQFAGCGVMQRTFRYYSPGDIQANYRPRQAYGQFSTNHELEKGVRALPRVQGFGKVDILLHDANGYPTSMHVGTASQRSRWHTRAGSASDTRSVQVSSPSSPFLSSCPYHASVGAHTRLCKGLLVIPPTLPCPSHSQT